MAVLKTQIPAIQEAQRVEAEHQKERWQGMEKRQDEIKIEVDGINDNLTLILMEIRK